MLELVFFQGGAGISALHYAPAESSLERSERSREDSAGDECADPALPGKDQRHRFQSTRDLAFALEAVAMERGSGSTTSVEAPARRGLRPAILAWGALSL